MTTEFLRRGEASCAVGNDRRSTVGAETTLKRTGEAKILKSSGNFRNLLTAAMLFGFFALAGKATAQTIVDQGYCGGEGNGTNLTWVLKSDDILTISGSGDMDDWTSFGNLPWYSYLYRITTVIIGNGVTSIGDYAFSYCRLNSVNIPNSVTSIGSAAFFGCDSLNSIIIPNSVLNIGIGAFNGCQSLTSVIIPNSVTSIENRTFYNCSSLTSVTIGNRVTSIGEWVFNGCSSLISITIPDSVTNIDKWAFSGCSNLTSININSGNSRYSSIDGIVYSTMQDTLFLCPMGKTGTIVIPNSVTAIEDNAFYGCRSLNSVIIPDSVTIIGDYAFCNCDSLDSITIPNSVISIGYGAFYYCRNLSFIAIPNSVTSIGESAFYGCRSLISVMIGNSVANIGDYAFYGCNNLSFVTSHAIVPPTLGINTFRNVPDTIPIYILCPSYDSYSNDSAWSYFSNFIEQRDTTFYSASICAGNIYNDANFSNLTDAGIYYDTLQSINGCDSIIALTLSVNDCKIDISGKIKRADQTFLSYSEVELYLVQNGSPYILMDTASIANDGSYQFLNVFSGKYVIKAIPDSSENALPTYYSNTEHWHLADTVTVADSLPIQNIDIMIIPLPSPSNGNSFISGFVGDDNEGSQSISQKSVEHPAVDVNVYLQKYQSGWITLARTLTNENGYFEFCNISAGKYQVILDIPGTKHLDNPQVIDINEGDTIQNIEYEITENGIKNKSGDDVGVKQLQGTSYELQIYPNPTSGKLQVTSYESGSIEIYDVVGQCVFTTPNPTRVTTPNPSKGGESSTSAQFPSFGRYFLNSRMLPVLCSFPAAVSLYYAQLRLWARKSHRSLRMSAAVMPGWPNVCGRPKTRFFHLFRMKPIMIRGTGMPRLCRPRLNHRDSPSALKLSIRKRNA